MRASEERKEQTHGISNLARRGDNLIVESSRVSVEKLNDRYGNFDISKRLYESTEVLKGRNKGLSDVMNFESNEFYEKFSRDINDIETINGRMEVAIEVKVQERIKKFGIDGKRILGIDIHVPEKSLVRSLEKTEYGTRNMDMQRDR